MKPRLKFGFYFCHLISKMVGLIDTGLFQGYTLNYRNLVKCKYSDHKVS